MKPIIISSNEWVYPDILDYPSAAESINLHTPRSSYASAQILIPDTRPGASISVSYEGPLAFEGYRLLDVIVERNSGDGESWHTLDVGTPKPDYCTRQAPFPVFDILQPLDQGGDIVEKDSTAFYVCWQIPKDSEPGVYTGILQILIADDSCSIPVTITVHKATVPEPKHLSITNWYTDANVGPYYGLEKFTDAWYSMLEKFFKLMTRTRQTHIIIPLAVDIQEPAPGYFIFDFSQVERIANLAIDTGFQTLEFGHLCIKNYVKLEPYWLFYQPNGRKIYADTPEGYNFLAQFLPSWTAFLKKHGWYDHCVQHVGDEPTAEQTNDYRIICGIVRKFMPGIKLFDAVCDLNLAGSVDCWVLQNHHYQKDRKAYDKFRDYGDEIWQYTCCCPSGPWLNRLLDGELLKPRLLHYGNYLFNLPGYLHWGFNYYQGGMEHLRKKTCGLSSDGIHYWPAGDTNICYPGNEKGPWMSIRAERMRTGAEDCELLWMIADHNKKLADTLCTNVMRAFDEYEKDVNAFDKNYIQILETADLL